MDLRVDPDVQEVAEFMQRRIAASRLVGVADALAAIAPVLWGRYQPEMVDALRLDGGITAPAQTPTASIE